MQFSEFAGETQVDPAHTVTQLTGWFNKDDKLVIVGMKSVRGAGKNVVSQVVTAGEFVNQLRGPGGQELLQGLSLSPDGTRWDLYFSVASVTDSGTITRRGGIDNIKHVLGVYVDLDVKPGSFESDSAALEFLSKLPPTTLTTATGSGGIHGYWKFDRPISADEAAKVQRAWWALLSERAAPVFIDYLVDTSRVMRLAGSIRWPKAGEEIPPHLSTVLQRNLPAVYRSEDLLEWSREAADRRAAKVRETRARDNRRKSSSTVLANLAKSDNEWAQLSAVANVEDTFNELMTWEEILEPLGWTFLRQDRDGRWEVARPGSRSKSGSCGWPESPHILSLHSWSPETGLADLKEAGVVLTKFRVAQRLLWQDNYDAIVAWTLENA
jgi:hypothetical protein